MSESHVYRNGEHGESTGKACESRELFDKACRTLTMTLRISLFALSVLFACGQCLAQSGEAGAKRTELDKLVPGWLREFDVPAVSIAYVAEGKLQWTAHFGEQSPGVPASAKTVYNVASLTKPVTAEVILRLVSQGKIALDESMAPHWVDPDVQGNPWHKLLTPRLSLSHQTGFTNWRYQTKDVLQMQWKPGSKTGYSGEGYDYVARFAEKKLGRTFPDLAAELVFRPLAMNETSFVTQEWHAGRVAYPHSSKLTGPPKPVRKWSAADLLQTTIDDYAKFLISVMRDEAISGSLAAERVKIARNVATPKDVRQVCSVAKLPEAQCAITVGMGLGWQILKINGETFVQHSGADPGVRTTVFFVPAKKIGVVIFTNGEEGRKVIQKIGQLLYPNPILSQVL